jgi:hypothetical protein
LPFYGDHPADVKVSPGRIIADSSFNAIDDDSGVARIKLGTVDKNAAESRYRSLPDNPGAVDPATGEKRTAG